VTEMTVRWVLFDLNGTLLNPSGIADPLGGGEKARRLVAQAFQEALLLTMADTLSGGHYRPLTEYLRGALERGLRAEGRGTGDLDAAIQRAGAMDPFPEAASALTALRAADLRCGVLTNSSTEAAERALAYIWPRARNPDARDPARSDVDRLPLPTRRGVRVGA